MTATPTTSVLDEVITWPGINTQPTPRGATAIVLDGQELGHVHPDRRTLDMPLAPDRREQVLAAKRAEPWFSNYVSKPLKTDADAQDAVELLRASYNELRPNPCPYAPDTAFEVIAPIDLSLSSPAGDHSQGPRIEQPDRSMGSRWSVSESHL